MKLAVIFISFVMLFSQTTFGQTKTDSIDAEIRNAKNDTTKVRILTEFSVKYRKVNLDTAFGYARQAKILALKIKPSKIQTEALLNFGKFHLFKGQYDSSALAYEIAYEKAVEFGDKKLIGLALHSIGNANLYLQKNEEALDFYIKALKIRESINDTTGIAASTNNIGTIYWNLSNYDKALEYYQKSLDAELKSNNEAGIASSFNNIGLIYWKKNEYDKALDFFWKSMALKEKLGDNVGAATTINNIAIIHRSRGDYRKAISEFRKSLKIYEEVESQSDIANGFNNLASCYNKLNMADSAFYCASKALPIIKEIGYLMLEKDCYSYMAVALFDKKRYKEAYDYLYKYTVLKDSIFDEQSSKQIAEAETKFESEKKQKEIEIQNLKLKENDTEISFRKRINILMFVIFGIIALFLAFVLKLLHDRKKANQALSMKNAEIFQQKEEIETQANNLQEANDQISMANSLLTEQKEEISKKNKTITFASEQIKAGIRYAYTIQQALLPFSDRISKIFDHFILYRPKDIVSGDFYWMSNQIIAEQQKLCVFAVSDCTGHGVPGAFLSLTGMHLLDKIVHENHITSPSEILIKLNEYVGLVLNQSETKNRDGMDISVITMAEDVKTGKRTYIFEGAKRNLVYFSVSKNEVLTVKGSRKSIGGFSGRNTYEFEDKHVEIEDSDTIYLYTDGITDQCDVDRKRFGSEHFKQFISEIVHFDFEVQKQKLNALVDDIRGETEQRDDITIIALKKSEQS